MSHPICYYLDGDDPETFDTHAVVVYSSGSWERVSYDRCAYGSSRDVLPDFPGGVVVRYDRPAGHYLVSDDRRYLFAGRARDDRAATLLLSILRYGLIEALERHFAGSPPPRHVNARVRNLPSRRGHGHARRYEVVWGEPSDEQPSPAELAELERGRAALGLTE